jgi:hypothetical protein
MKQIITPSRVIPGQLSNTDAEAICILAHSVPENGTVVEVGSLYGFSSWLWSKNTPQTATIYCIDPWIHEPWIDKVRDRFGAPDLSLAAFINNVADCHNIRAIQGYSPDCCASWTREIDGYFDDADHRNPVLTRNIHFWSSFVREGGFCAGHDYSPSHPDVIAEANELAARWGSSVEVKGSVWSVVRKHARIC